MRKLETTVLLTLLAVGAWTPAARAQPSPADILAQTAQDVADALCPFSMLRQFGCPRNTTGNNGTANNGGNGAAPRPRETRHLNARARHIREHVHRTLHEHATRAAQQHCAGDDAAGAADDSGLCDDLFGVPPPESFDAATESSGYQERVPGSVPVGVGFDITEMEARLPFFFPVVSQVTVAPVHSSSSKQQAFNTIAQYNDLLAPSNVEHVTTGSLNTDPGAVFNAYFKHESGLLRTVQTDIVRNATLDTSNPFALFMLPYVDWLVNEVLPDTYDEATYTAFIENWGTHIVTKASLGGACELMASVSSCYLDGSAEMLSVLAQAAMGQGTDQSPTKTSFDSNYSSHVLQSTVTMYGGNPIYGEPYQWKEREATIAEAPVLVHVDELVPIYEFVNPALKPHVQANLKQAVASWQSTAEQRRQTQMEDAIKAASYTVTVTGQTHFDDFVLSYGGTHVAPSPSVNLHNDEGMDPFTGTMSVRTQHTQPDVKVGQTFPTSLTSTSALDCTNQMRECGNSVCNGCICCCWCGHHTNWNQCGDIDGPVRSSASLEVTCEMTAQGVVATDVTSTYYEDGRHGGTSGATLVPGKPELSGCSKATRTYTGGSWSVSTGGGVSGDVSQIGTVTFEGWCCIGMSQMAVGANCDSPNEFTGCAPLQ